MKEEDVTPGTIYPLLGKVLCFLPEHLKKKLCCVTPLGQTVSKPPLRCNDSFSILTNNHVSHVEICPSSFWNKIQKLVAVVRYFNQTAHWHVT